MLTDKQIKFVEAYLQTGLATQSAISAGYAPKSAYVEANRLLKNSYVLAELQQWRAKKNQEISKDDLVNYALRDYDAVSVEQANRPRFLELAGKMLGHIGSNEANRPNQTVNVQVNITGSESQGQIWELTRKLLGNE